MTSSKQEMPFAANMKLGPKLTCVLAGWLGTQLVLAGQALESGLSPLQQLEKFSTASQRRAPFS
jgi:hypothetical protein